MTVIQKKLGTRIFLLVFFTLLSYLLLRLTAFIISGMIDIMQGSWTDIHFLSEFLLPLSLAIGFSLVALIMLFQGIKQFCTRVKFDSSTLYIKTLFREKKIPFNTISGIEQINKRYTGRGVTWYRWHYYILTRQIGEETFCPPKRLEVPIPADFDVDDYGPFILIREQYPDVSFFSRDERYG